MSQNTIDRVETERCVENIVKKTLIGYAAPLSLFLVFRNGRFVHNMMLIGGGFGLGHAMNDCSRNSKCSFKDSLPFFTADKKCCPKTSCCSTVNKPQCTKNNVTTITTEAQQE